MELFGFSRLAYRICGANEAHKGVPFHDKSLLVCAGGDMICDQAWAATLMLV